MPEEVPTYQFREEISPPIKPKTSLKKILLSLVISVVLISVAGAAFYFYPKIVKPDPISLLPEETIFYFRVKINPEEEQVKNFKEILNKFPYYQKISQKIGQEFEKLKEENPPLKNLDFTISKELILAIISPIEEETKEPPLVLILPNPDLKKLEKLVKDVQKSIEESGDWKIEEETYKGRAILKAVPAIKPSPYGLPPREPEIEPSTALISGHFFLSSKPEKLKKIIDVAEDQEITNIFKKDKIKNITLTPSHQKIRSYLAKDYLTLFYGQFDWSKILKTTESQTAIENKFLSPFIASLKTALNLPFFKKTEIKEPEKVAFAGVIIAEKDRLKTENYSLDLREEAFSPAQFSFENSLLQFIPEKIGKREIVYYEEGRDLKGSFEEVEKILTKEMEEEEKKEFDKILKSLKEFLGIDLKEDILALFDKNYAFLIASEPTGQETSIAGFLFEVDDEEKAKENLLKIKIPKSEEPFDFLGLEGSRKKAKDARIMADLHQLRTMAEMIYDDDGSYRNVKCNYKSPYGDLKMICQDIKEQVGFEPVIYSTTDKYCAYSKLNTPGQYYCVDSGGRAISTYINPGQTGYCSGKTFLCPKTPGMPPSEEIPPLEELTFTKEIVDGFEIYSLPIFENLGLNFSIKEKKLILTFTEDALVNILKNLANHEKLKDSQVFAEQFKEFPKSLTRISYSYPQGFLGVIKNLVNFYLGLMKSFEPGMASEIEAFLPSIFELLDKGIAPYLKVLKSSGFLSYSPEKGLVISKGGIIIQELPAAEKKATEEFWENIKTWFEEKFPHF
jgi:hypothetical protein